MSFRNTYNPECWQVPKNTASINIFVIKFIEHNVNIEGEKHIIFLLTRKLYEEIVENLFLRCVNIFCALFVSIYLEFILYNKLQTVNFVLFQLPNY